MSTGMNMIMLADVWKNYPLIAFVLAALQTIPKELYDAARMDGASAWQRFTSITLPGFSGRSWWRSCCAPSSPSASSTSSM